MINTIKSVYWIARIYTAACVSYYHMRKEDKINKISNNGRGIKLSP